MTDSRRGPAEGASPLTHTDAEALISARMDGPLDPGLNRALLAHLASCADCRAFASQMDFMATAVRDIPSLPPSAAVSRKVRAEIRGESAPFKRFITWVTTSKAAPLGALGTAAVALALVSASVFGDLGDDGRNGSSVNAPNIAATESQQTSAADQAAETNGDTAAQIPNIQVTQAPPAADAAAESQIQESEGVEDAENAEQPENEAPVTADNAAVGSAGDDTESSADAADTGSENAAADQPGDLAAASGLADDDGDDAGGVVNSFGAGLGDGTGGDQQVMLAKDEGTPEPTSTSEPEPTETATPEPEPTETATAEPTATEEPAPTETTAPVPTATDEPEPTETPEPTPATPEPEATASPTPATPEAEEVEDEETATPEPTATTEPSPTPTEEPEDAESPPIVPRDDNPIVDANDSDTEPSDDGTSIEQRPSDSDDSAASGTGSAGTTDDASAGDEVADDEVDDADSETAETELAEEAPEPVSPASFGELDAVGSMGTSGVLLVGNGGYYAAERPGGGLEIISADGTVVVSGWGYNPVWSEDGQTVYAADGSLSEGGAALIGWSLSGGPTYVTSGGSGYDTPAGAANGGLFFVRYQPGAEFSLQLRFTGGEDYVVWESGDYALVGQGIYLYGGEVFIPTDQGWIAVPTGGGEPRNVGSVLGGEYDQVLDHASGMIAYASGGSVYVAPATSPGSAMLVGELGNGGFAWTPYGLALASGGQVSMILSDGSSIPVITDGGDLTAPSWTGDGLRVTDATDGGTIRFLPANVISSILEG